MASGFTYYGYRYLDTQLGRWLSRDPIGERGEVNLYAFVGNSGLASLDNIGLSTKLSTTIHAVYEWWSSWKGPGGKHGTQAIGQSDPYLYTLTGEAEASCFCGHPVVSILRQDDKTIDPWWGQARGTVLVLAPAGVAEGNTVMFSIMSSSKSGTDSEINAFFGFVAGVGAAYLTKNPWIGAGVGTAASYGAGEIWEYLIGGDGRIRHDITVTCPEWSVGEPPRSKPASVDIKFGGENGIGNRWLFENYVPRHWVWAD